MVKEQSFLDKLYKDKNGKVALLQRPNLVLLTWVASAILSHVLTHGRPHELFVVTAFGALFTWAWLELFQGDSYARRALGLVVLIATILNQIR